MSYLTEAFKEMELLESNTFDFNKNGAEKLSNFMENDVLDEFETVIDPEAETEEELQPSYIGMGILGCDVCKAMIYKPMEEIIIDDETKLANVGETCPYCYTADGFKIIGKVAPFEEISVEVEPKEAKNDGVGEVDVKVDGKKVPVEEKEEEKVVEESYTEEQKFPFLKKALKKKMRESFLMEGEGTPDIIINEEDLIYHDMKSGNIKMEKNDAIKFEKDKDVKIQFQDKNDIINIYRMVSEDENGIEMVFVDYIDAADEDLEDSQRFPIEKPKAKDTGFVSAKDKQPKSNVEYKDTGFVSAEDKGSKEFAMNESKEHQLNEETNMDKIWRALGEMGKIEEPVKESINESMEDISITTEDTVIKVKATPRADKETIEPVSEEEVKAASEEEKEEVVEEEPIEEAPIEEETDLEIEEIDDEGFDQLGESYLKKVYENVNSFKTSDCSQLDGKLIMEGVITFNSGKKAKTKFIFESAEMSKKGKIKFTGLNEQISKNKKAFTITGAVEGKKLMIESFNYNYLGHDASGSKKARKVYGTINK